MSIQLPKLRGTTGSDHPAVVADNNKAILSSIQSIQPEITAQIKAAATGSGTAQQLFNLNQKLAAINATLLSLQTQINAIDSTPPPATTTSDFAHSFLTMGG